MTDEHSLLGAIVAHPDEDTPRLMYADWLQEHGKDTLATLTRADWRAWIRHGTEDAEDITPRWGELAAVVPGPPSPDCVRCIGSRFGPVVATEDDGRRWQCEGILTDVSFERDSKGDECVRYNARTTGPMLSISPRPGLAPASSE